jgi:hypothetical protein
LLVQGTIALAVLAGATWLASVHVIAPEAVVAIYSAALGGGLVVGAHQLAANGHSGGGG